MTIPNWCLLLIVLVCLSVLAWRWMHAPSVSVSDNRGNVYRQTGPQTFTAEDADSIFVVQVRKSEQK